MKTGHHDESAVLQRARGKKKRRRKQIINHFLHQDLKPCDLWESALFFLVRLVLNTCRTGWDFSIFTECSELFTGAFEWSAWMRRCSGCVKNKLNGTPGRSSALQRIVADLTNSVSRHRKSVYVPLRLRHQGAFQHCGFLNCTWRSIVAVMTQKERASGSEVEKKSRG